MSPRIIAVTNNKGGVGKTHTVFHLSGAFAEQGKRVLVVDLDPQGNLTSLLLPNRERPGTLFDVLVEDVPLAQTVHATEFDGISIVPSTPQLENLDAFLQNEPDAQIRLADALQELAHGDAEPFDVILLDCPPSLALTTRSALAAARHVLIPLEADKFSVEGLDRLVRAIQSLKRAVNPHLEIAGILISLFKERRTIENLYAEALGDRAIHVFETRIKDSTKYREAITARRPITHYKPTSEFADAFRNLTRELEQAYATRTQEA